MDLTGTEAARLLHSRRKAIAGEANPGARGPAGMRRADPDALREVAEIDAALARIADGTYGACEACGGAIGRDRLRALPLARRCLRCTG
jgi:RNA polymerase-binding transcription factor